MSDTRPGVPGESRNPARWLYIGIDDTDTHDSPGTNQLARRLAAALPPGFTFQLSLRHQLLFDPRVPYTSQNGSASLLVRVEAGDALAVLPVLEHEMRAWYVPGSDPGLCVAEVVPDIVTAFGRRAQCEMLAQDEARAVARGADVYLEGFGGTNGGVIGALAAVGLLASGDDGRVVHRGGWSWPDPFSGVQPAHAILARGVDAIVDQTSGALVESGLVDLGKHLRPAYRGGRVVLYVEPAGGPEGAGWRAMKLP